MSAAKEQPEIAYAWLEPHQYGVLAEQYAEWGAPLPDPALSRVLVAIDTGANRLAGFLVFQTVVHAEPIFVSEEYRASALGREMVERGFEPFRKEGAGFYAFIPDDRPEVRRMALAAGMTIRDWKVAEIKFEGGK